MFASGSIKIGYVPLPADEALWTLYLYCGGDPRVGPTAAIVTNSQQNPSAFLGYQPIVFHQS
jgi:hypothetical protein